MYFFKMKQLKNFSETTIGKVIIGILATVIAALILFFAKDVTESKASKVQDKSDYNMLNQKIDNYINNTENRVKTEKIIIYNKMDSVVDISKEQQEILNKIMPLLNQIAADQKTIAQTQVNQTKVLKQVCKQTKDLQGFIPFLETSQN